MILQVHDELVFDVPKDEEEIFYTLIRETMEEVLIHGRQYVI
jgi:DNA polymerase I-like protein with 3'-5' exonuclease and polymerase domains